MECLFVSDLHGKEKKYELLFDEVEKRKPDAVFIGGDILPGFIGSETEVRRFLKEGLFDKIEELRSNGIKTRFFVIMGNDDPREFESVLKEADDEGLIHYIHKKKISLDGMNTIGYSFIPPSPFQLKDWEKYDVSRFVDVGAVSPERGIRTVDVEKNHVRYSTISDDLDELKKLSPPEETIYLFHSPPHDTDLDRADLDGKKVDHAPLDVHVGSIAVKRFIENEQPFLTLHGHIHETVRLTGNWKQKFGDTYSFSAAHDGGGLAVVYFDTDDLSGAHREILKQ